MHHAWTFTCFLLAFLWVPVCVWVLGLRGTITLHVPTVSQPRPSQPDRDPVIDQAVLLEKNGSGAEGSKWLRTDYMVTAAKMPFNDMSLLEDSARSVIESHVKVLENNFEDKRPVTRDAADHGVRTDGG